MNLNYFKEKNFFNALNALFNTLNIPTNGGVEEPVTVKEILKDTYKDNDAFSLVKDVYFVGIVDDAAFEGNASLSKDEIQADYDGLLIFGITLNQRASNLLPTRSQLAEISRAFNREFYYTPVALVFKYQDDQDNYLALANTERLTYKQEWREGEKAGKVSLLRDININNTHSGHQQILSNMSINGSINSFDSLYKHWQTVFSVSLLSKRFYAELSNWYFWAVKEVTFPSEPTMQSMFEATGKNDEKKLEELKQEHNAKNVIRLLTRLLFVWFIKEKKLVPDELFDLEYIKENILKDLSPIHEDGLFYTSTNINSHYYKAILQNLFFATLNQEMGKRSFRNDKQHTNVTNLMRYQGCFKNPKEFIDLVESKVPFMNGGLFECLDKPHLINKNAKGGDLIFYKDGFSDHKENNVVVPDYLFFGVDEQVDLSSIIGISNNNTKKSAVKGLINIFNSYKFTISENTPIEEDVALDPELLGKVFENLLASYNPETKTTARKQSGSFYTPREIVNYMVDESLISYLKNTACDWNISNDELDKNLHKLLSFEKINPFQDETNVQTQIIEALYQCKILDPACGSGAFPMGILQKIVHVLDKIDPNGAEWNRLQINKVNFAIESLEILGGDKFIEQEIRDLKDQIKDIEDAFEDNGLDYGRKLFLIENCIFGVDIQPIAIQISKLRFFISLMVDQKINKSKDNFGIRPLPNLETKFVAANTLIGINKLDGQLSLFDKKEVIKLEQELKIVRHKLFSSKVPKRKRELRIEDENLRENIATLLENGGVDNKTSRQLAVWDPYDQFKSTDFFDAEWMFDVKDGFDIVIANPPYIEHKKLKNIANILKPFYQVYTGSSDLSVYFFEKGFELLKDDGVLIFINTNKFFNTGYGKALRKFLLTKKIISLINFEQVEVFENILVSSVIYLSQNSSPHDSFTYSEFKQESNWRKDFLDKIKLKSTVFKQSIFGEGEWKFVSNEIRLLKTKIEENARPIKDIKDIIIKRGVTTGYDPAFIVDEKKAIELNCPELIKSLIKGGDIKKYLISFSDKYLINLHNGQRGLCEPIDIKNFPNALLHLEEINIKSDNAVIDRTDQGRHWTNLRSCAFLDLFEQKKIVWPLTADKWGFALDDSGYYLTSGGFFLVSKTISLEFILGVLNSNLMKFYFSFIGVMTAGGAFTLKKSTIEQLPIKVDYFYISKIESKVIEILKNKKLHPGTDTTALEYEIDQLIYQLYSFTEKEIAIVEDMSNK
ncbi:hypothetical protein HOB87_12820 [Candidatus Woesearchaeota archaeon]|jgi:hypothetical protein|nr:hypothetical protein [Candidatus Woesearchaeota archaeon]MBT7555648.1 hypothetical protein [Candidatus Woesearchaeota archaeon]